ncbi:hypothetical protein FB567DRAFT_263195 [Paraphoma chrysanthemicola]|uniref:Uncharacterized protein n=1 Tax=Paraphoma chrysanthemicola TaxID=798071 RepID=A0A8K0W0Y5_9PLEO|nr:hypothetical protein FB567DRAFT_263195 [Paraphoma chrysanthemicola]
MTAPYSMASPLQQSHLGSMLQSASPPIHHYHSPSPSFLPASTPSVSETPAFDRQQLAHIDRDSAVALGCILILILAAIAYYVHLKLKRERQMCVERQMEEQRRDGLSSRSTAGPAERGAGSMSFRMNNIWSKAPKSRQGSAATLVGSDMEPGKRASWPNSISSHSSSTVTTCVGSSNSSIAPHALDGCPFHLNRCSRTPSPSSRTAPLLYYAPSAPPPTARSRSNHRRTSSIHNLPIAVVSEQRHASLSQTQNDERWLNDVPRRGSNSQADRRFSVLESIPEPEIVSGNNQAHSKCPGAVHDTEIRDYDGKVGGGSESSSIAGKMSGDSPRSTSRSTSRIAVYDWARPAVDEVAKSTPNSKKVKYELLCGHEDVDWETRTGTRICEDSVDPHLSN